MTTETQPATQEVKQVNQYKMTLKTTTEPTDPDAIVLNIQLSNEFNDLLKNIAVTTMPTLESYYNSGDDNAGGFQRYPLKRWVLGSVGQTDYLLMLFEKGLVDDGQTTFKVYNVRKLEYAIAGLKQAMKSLIQTYLSFNHIEQVVTVNIEGTTHGVADQ